MPGERVTDKKKVLDPGTVAGESFDRLSTRLRVEGSTWSFDNILLEKGAGTAKGHASINPSSRALAIELDGANFALENIKLLRPSGKNANVISFNGLIGFELRSAGTLENPNLQASWNCRSVSLNGTAVGDIEGQLNWQGREIQLKGESKGAAGEVSFSGTTRAEGDWPLQLSGTYANLPVEPWLHLMLGKRFEARVTASGTVTVKGPMKDVSRIEVRAQSQNLEVKFPSLTWKNEQPVDF